jgi:hypothetical protein
VGVRLKVSKGPAITHGTVTLRKGKAPKAKLWMIDDLKEQWR